ncbi:hypothetical protein GCM10010168_70680 [Actinoplanes ianthinogenes]|nr:hypothetical protein GCM10010168_70680 [Actinoplanes ianthinogenes]
MTVAVAALAGCGSGEPAAEPSGPLTEAQAVAACQKDLTELNSAMTPRLRERFVVRDGDRQIRIYTSEADKWISTCRVGPSGAEETFGTVTTDGPADKITLYGDLDAVLKAKVLIGKLPAKATGITAKLPSGRTLTGSRDGDLFLVWAPDTPVERAVLTATGKDGKVLATVTAPGV